MRALDSPASFGAPGHGQLALRGAQPIWGRLTAALIALTVVAASLALLVGQSLLKQPDLDAFLASNALAPATRSVLLGSMAAAVLLTWILSGLHLGYWMLRGRRRRADWPSVATDRLWRAAGCLSPLSVAAALPSLLNYRLWFSQPLQHLIYLLVVVLAFEQFVRWCLASLPAWIVQPTAWLVRRIPRVLSRHAPAALVIAGAVLYSAFAGYYTLIEHRRFAYGGLGLGAANSTLANLLAGKFLYSPLAGDAASQAELGALLIVPVYALAPRAETLLWLEAGCLGLAAIPLYAFAATQLPRAQASLVAVVYLLYAPLHAATFHDFHLLSIGVPLWFVLFYGIARRRLAIVVPALILLLPLHVQTGAMLAVLGAFLLFSNYWPRLGASFCVAGTLWFGVMKLLEVPLSGNGLEAAAEQQSSLFTGLVNQTYLLKTLATESRLVYLLYLIAPLALLPLRKPLLVLLVLPGLLFALLGSSDAASLPSRFQDTAACIPWLFAASILYLELLGEREQGRSLQRAALGALLFGVACHSFVYGAVLQRNVFATGAKAVAFGMTASEHERYRAFLTLAGRIPSQSSVAASHSIISHLGSRPNIGTFRAPAGAEYLFVDRRSFADEDRKQVSRTLQKQRFGLVEAASELYLFKKNHRSAKTRAAFDALRVTGATE